MDRPDVEEDEACPVQTYPWGRWQSTPLCAACQTGCHHAISEDSLGLELELGLLVDRAARQHRPESNSSTAPAPPPPPPPLARSMPRTTE